MIRPLACPLIIAAIGLCGGNVPAADAPRVRELRTQKVAGRTYFHVRFERPADLQYPTFDRSRPFSGVDRRNFARLPQLVPQDGAARAVCYRHKLSRASLSFYGQALGKGKARLLLRYPTKVAPTSKAPRRAMAEAIVELDFAKALEVPVPANDPLDQHLKPNDLRGHWALYQAAHFAVLETQVLDFPFYSFAREATGRKYDVVAPAWVQRQIDDPQPRLYEITTGADAITETLQLHRLLQENPKAGGKRSVPLSEVTGVTVPPQPWEKLLAGKKPTTEPMARLVPHDNYYLHFRSLRKFNELGELLDQWGTNVIRAYEMKSRDCQLRQRYEKQLCLKSTALGKVFGPALVKGLAVTGNDPYLREGSDVTIIFHVVNSRLFLAAVDGFLEEARREHGKQLREEREKYHGATIETFVTPLREVSLHRAVLGDFVIYSNSPAAARRVIDAHAGRIKRLADEGDFQYMRTVFPVDDKTEHGFAFLSDAFIRRLTGPAVRIKEKRRLEALTSLSMLTNAALFCAWETGSLPANHAAALAAAGLRPFDVVVPDGKAVWDADRRLAISDVYNTIHFATPLVELTIDQVTPAEAAEYKRFRDEYTELWRAYFDPIGLRLSIDEKQVRIQTHVLPLAGSGQYQSRQGIASGTFNYVPRQSAVVEFRLGVERETTLAFHLDKTPLLAKMLELLIRWDAESGVDLRKQYDRLFWQLPIGVSGKGPYLGNANLILEALQYIAKDKPQLSKHEGVSITRIPISADKYRQVATYLNAPAAQQEPFGILLALLPTQQAPEAFHVATIDGSVHVTPNESFIKKLIDEAKAPKQPAASTRKSNAALSISPGNARETAGRLLEYESHRLALLNNQVWNCFYQTGLLKRETDIATAKQTAQHFLGYVPVSPDGSPYLYDARLGDVINRRHGSFRRPTRHEHVEATSELGRLLEHIEAVRVELRFRNNGLHSVLTIERR